MFVYILASKTRRLYVGVTNDLVRRVWEHREGVVPGFTRRYGIKQLVYFETFTGPIGLPTFTRPISRGACPQRSEGLEMTREGSG